MRLARMKILHSLPSSLPSKHEPPTNAPRNPLRPATQRAHRSPRAHWRPRLPPSAHLLRFPEAERHPIRPNPRRRRHDLHTAALVDQLGAGPLPLLARLLAAPRPRDPTTIMPCEQHQAFECDREEPQTRNVPMAAASTRARLSEPPRRWAAPVKPLGRDLSSTRRHFRRSLISRRSRPRRRPLTAVARPLGGALRLWSCGRKLVGRTFSAWRRILAPWMRLSTTRLISSVVPAQPRAWKNWMTSSQLC